MGCSLINIYGEYFKCIGAAVVTSADYRQSPTAGHFFSLFVFHIWRQSKMHTHDWNLIGLRYDSRNIETDQLILFYKNKTLEKLANQLHSADISSKHTNKRAIELLLIHVRKPRRI